MFYIYTYIYIYIYIKKNDSQTFLRHASLLILLMIFKHFYDISINDFQTRRPIWSIAASCHHNNKVVIWQTGSDWPYGPYRLGRRESVCAGCRREETGPPSPDRQTDNRQTADRQQTTDRQTDRQTGNQQTSDSLFQGCPYSSNSTNNLRA